MGLSKHLYTGPPLSGEQARALLVVGAVGGGVMMVLLLALCVCWGRNSNGLVGGRGDSRRDTVPLDDLLSKPSLADPESVFSEAGSNDFRPIPRAGSRFVASGDENSFWHESGSVSGPGNGDRDTSCSHFLVGINNDPDPNSGLPARKGKYQGKQLSKTNKSAQQLELEQLQLQNRQNFDNEATSRSACSHRLKTTADPGHLGSSFVHDIKTSVHTTGGSPKTGSHKDISEKVGLDPASLKMHRDSVPADSAPFLSPARCSFSHEVGHIVHGNQTPRPSLPRTEEVENDQAGSSPDPKNVHDSSRKATRLSVEVKATELSVNVPSGQFEELPPANVTFNSQGQVRGQDLLVNETTDSTHRVSLSYQCVSIQDTQQPSGDIMGSTTANGKVNPDVSCQIAHSKSHVNNQISTGRPASDLDQCQLAGVTMRRCLSCVQDDAVCPEPATKSRRQTFSLNLKIDVHFDNERESCENLATVVCSPLMEYTSPGNHAVADSSQLFTTSVSINKNNNNNNSINDSHSQGGGRTDTDAKERQLEKSFADKSLQRNNHTFASVGKQCSGLSVAEVSRVKTCNTGQASQRLSAAGSLTDTSAGAAVLGAEGAARSGLSGFQAASRNLAATDEEIASESTGPGDRSGQVVTDAEAASESAGPGDRSGQVVTDAEAASENTATASGDYRAGQGVSSSPADVMTPDADVSRAGRMAANAQAEREITVEPTTIDKLVPADSDSGIFPTQCQLPQAVSPGAESSTQLDRADVSPGAESSTELDRAGVSPGAESSTELDRAGVTPGAESSTDTYKADVSPGAESSTDTYKADVSAEADTGKSGAGPSLGKVVPVSVAGGDRLLADGVSAHGADVMGISNSSVGQNEHSCDVTHILRETEPVGLNGKSQEKDMVVAKMYQEKRSTASRITDDNCDVVGETACHSREESCHHHAMVNTAQTSISTSDTNHHHPDDAVRSEAVVSSQRVDDCGHSKDEHCKPKSIGTTSLFNPGCKDATNRTHSNSSLSEETTDTMAPRDSNLSEKTTDTKRYSYRNLSGESVDTTTHSDSNVSGESTERKTHSDDRLVEETSDGNRAGSVHPPDEGSIKQTAAVDCATKTPDIHRRALTVKEGHIRTMPQTNQTGDAKFQRSASVKTTSVRERPRPSLGSSDKTQDRRQAVFFHDMKDLTTESAGRASQEKTHEKQSEYAALGVTARTQGRLTDSTVDTNTLNDQDHMTPGFNQGGPETIMKGHTQMMKQRLTGSALRAHATTPPHKQEAAVELVSVSPQDQGTVPRISTKAPKAAPRRWPADTNKRDSPAHEPDVSAGSVIAINIEDCTASMAPADGSDDSDYDNPWDSLDDAVKRASIRYNRRPSRIAAGDTKTLLLKSAEDLGRLLEEADKRRQLRQTRNSCQVVSPETDSFTIPFTRFSPYRHTVKDTVSRSQMATAHSTETLLKTETTNYPQLSLLRPGDAVAADHRVLDAQRPMSLTSKVRAKITSPETKPRKK